MQFRRRGDPKWGAEMTGWVMGGGGGGLGGIHAEMLLMGRRIMKLRFKRFNDSYVVLMTEHIVGPHFLLMCVV